ncbi:MAG: aminotransferase class I/II-fold pyridoxal phosphate-dependent enzyme [Phycisphaerales bacterium]|nr:MAG: aminotransferase class I/II-fold pyridoxal phosphate-dependent enzyme [Phycisphaerales bacterium]
MTTQQTASRFDGFGATIFTEMSRLALEHDAINLGQGFPDFDGPDFVKDAACEAIRSGQNQYARSIGVPALNKAIAKRFQRESGLSPDPETEITVTTGCSEALAASFLGLVNPGDEVILFEPYYDSYRACVAMAGAKAKFITLKPPHFRIDEAALREAFSDKTRAILINTPHNPTGAVFNLDELHLIAELCKEHDAMAITDEVYEHLTFGVEHEHLAAVDGMYERTVTLSSLGKTFSFTGWKIGWAIAPPHLSNAVRMAHQYLTFASATPLQHGAVAAINAPDSYFDEFRAAYKRRRDLLVDGLARVGFKVHPPQGTYFVLADHTPFGFANDVAFCKYLIEEIGVAAIPPSAFYANPEEGKDLVRFAFCKSEAMLREAISRMSELKRREV